MSSSIKSIKEELIKNYLNHIFGKGVCTHCLKRHVPYSMSCLCNKKNHHSSCIYQAAEETMNEHFVTKIFLFSKSNIKKTKQRCEVLAHMASSGARKSAQINKMDNDSRKWHIDDAVDVIRKGGESVSHLLLWNNQKILDRKIF